LGQLLEEIIRIDSKIRQLEARREDLLMRFVLSHNNIRQTLDYYRKENQNMYEAKKSYLRTLLYDSMTGSFDSFLSEVIEKLDLN